MKNIDKTVVVGMSGGVDSSVSAYLLKKQGYKVVGLFMQNWQSEPGEVCTSEIDFKDASEVCDNLENSSLSRSKPFSIPGSPPIPDPIATPIRSAFSATSNPESSTASFMAM